MQTLTIKGLLTDEGLAAKLANMKDRKEVAQAALKARRGREVRLEQLGGVPEAFLVCGLRPWRSTLDLVPSKKRNAAYRRIRLKPKALPEGGPEFDGVVEVEEADMQEQGFVDNGNHATGWLTDQALGVDGALSTLRPLPHLALKGS